MKLDRLNQEELNEILELHKLWLNSNGIKGKKAVLNNIDLSFSGLSYADLSYASLSNVILSDADLRHINLSHANLINVDLSYTDLTDANLSFSILSHTNLSYAGLGSTDFKNADLRDANLENAIFYKTDLLYTKIDNMISIGNIGDFYRTVYYFYKADRVICGCFDGTFEEFKKAVKDKYGEDYGAYEKCIKTFEMYKEEN